MGCATSKPNETKEDGEKVEKAKKDTAAGEIQAGAAAYLARRRDDKEKDIAASIIQGSAKFFVEKKAAEAEAKKADEAKHEVPALHPVTQVLDSIAQLSNRLFGGDGAATLPHASVAPPTILEAPVLEADPTGTPAASPAASSSAPPAAAPATAAEVQPASPLAVEQMIALTPGPAPVAVTATAPAPTDDEHRWSSMPEPRPTMIVSRDPAGAPAAAAVGTAFLVDIGSAIAPSAVSASTLAATAPADEEPIQKL